MSQNIKVDSIALAAEVAELRRENAALRAALVEFRDACWDAFFLPAPNVKPYYALVKKNAAFLPQPKPKKAKR